MQLIKAAGSPGGVSPVALSKRYGVTHVQIIHDIKVLKQEVLEEVGQDITGKTHLVFNKVVADLLKGDNKDKFRAAKLMTDWNSWLFDLGVQKRMPTEVKDVSDYTLADAYKEIYGDKRDGNKKKKA